MHRSPLLLPLASLAAATYLLSTITDQIVSYLP